VRYPTEWTAIRNASASWLGRVPRWRAISGEDGFPTLPRQLYEAVKRETEEDWRKQRWRWALRPKAAETAS
jgi:hypothetical protein